MRLKIILLFVILAGCSPEQYTPIPQQVWKNVTVRVETRPAPVRAGMNEIWIITNDDTRRPVHDLIVTLGVSGSDAELVQAIQDGLTGVYRRAVAVRDPGRQRLIVRLQQQSEVGELHFPLIVSGE